MAWPDAHSVNVTHVFLWYTEDEAINVYKILLRKIVSLG